MPHSNCNFTGHIRSLTSRAHVLLSGLSNAPIAPMHDQVVDATMPGLLAELGFAVVPTAFVTPPSVVNPKR